MNQLGRTANTMTYFGLALLMYRRGAFEEGLTYIDSGLALGEPKKWRVHLKRTKAIFLLSSNSGEVAQQVADEAVQQAEQLGEVDVLISCMAVKQFVLNSLGHEDEALKLGQRAYAIAKEAGLINKAFPLANNLADHYYHIGEHKKAFEYAIEMLHLGEVDYPLAVPWMQAKLGALKLASLDFSGARGDLSDAISLFDAYHLQVESHNATSHLITCLLALSDPERALELRAQLPEAVSANGKDVMPLLDGRIAFCQGELRKAERSFEEALATFTDDSLADADDRVVCRLYLAAIALQRGVVELSHIEPLIRDLGKTGDWRLTAESPFVSKLYRYCINQGWYPKRFHPHLPENITTVLPTRDVLAVTTLGKVEAKLDGAVLDLPPKAYEVLVFLVLNQPCRAEHIIDALWGDLAKGRRNLKVQVRHIRQAMSECSR